MEQESKRIVREWNREIEADARRLAARLDEGRWKIVVWVVLEVMWLAGLFFALALLDRLGW